MAAGATVPMRADADLFAAAKAEGVRMSRSAAQQLNHWARLGKELEASGVLRLKDVENVLAGRARYDDLAALDQAAARTLLDQQADEIRKSLNFADEFREAGQTWVEADPDGRAVVRGGDE